MVFVTFSSLYAFEGASTPRFQIPHLDKMVHFTFYFVASILGILFLRERSQGNMSMKKAIWIMVFATIAFGVIMEILQHTFTVNRMGDYFDAMANTLGSFCGAIASKLYFSGKRKLKWKY